jgi:hypothetical protein
MKNDVHAEEMLGGENKNLFERVTAFYKLLLDEEQVARGRIGKVRVLDFLGSRVKADGIGLE